MELSENAKIVLARRYLAKDEQGNPIEDIQGMFWRVARHVASAERLYDPKADVEAIADKFYQSMSSLCFMPNSPTLMNAGRPLGNCRPALCCPSRTRWRTSSTRSKTPR
jgi:ribonucleoside-diphosphate reductase alpha chain